MSHRTLPDQRSGSLRLNRNHGAAPRDAVAVLLENFAREHDYVPPGARMIESSAELPSRLWSRMRPESPLSSWRAWTNGTQLWFLVGRLLTARSRSLDALLLEVCFFDHDGQRVATGAWALPPNGHWTLQRIGEPVELAAGRRSGRELRS